MKITFLGNFAVDFSTESHHLWTYRKLGHEVVPLQESKVDSQTVLKSALKSDLFIWTHTHAWHTPGMKNVLKQLRKNNIPSAGYHLDLWKGISRENDLNHDPYWDIEYFFTVDKLFVDDLKKRGIKAYFLPAGVVESECYLGTPNREKYPHDVIFVGSRGYHKEWPYRPQLIDWLKETYGDKFGHYGGDGLGVIRGKELNNLYVSAKVVVGDTLCQGFAYPYYSSDRLWEQIGRCAFTIYPKIKGLSRYFKDTEEVIYYPFDDFDRLQYLVDYYLQHDEERNRIRMAGFERCKKEGTYTERLKYLINTIQSR